MDRLFTHALALSLAGIGLSGCFVLFEKTADLKAVHTTYRDEFVDSRLVSDASEVGEKSVLTYQTFDKTLAAIADYRRRHPDATKEQNHLTVLEGMIYLQSGQYGLAELAKEDVQEAGGQLAGNATAPRDALFAATYGELITGWKAIAEQKSVLTKNAMEEANRLREAAKRIQAQLCDESSSNRLRLVQGDQGATYLAATGSVFLLWSDYYAKNFCASPRGDLNSEDEDLCLQNARAADLISARNLTWTFLPTHLQAVARRQALTQLNDESRPEEEKKPAIDSAIRSGSLRYLDVLEDIEQRGEGRITDLERDYVDVCKAPDDASLPR